MSIITLNQSRYRAFAVVALQFVLMVVVSVVFLIYGGEKAGWSAMFGGMAGVIPNLVVVSMLFSKWVTASPKRVQKVFLFGEGVKILVTIAIFIIALVWLEAEVAPLMATYAVTFLAFWLALLFTLAPPATKES